MSAEHPPHTYLNMSLNSNPSTDQPRNHPSGPGRFGYRVPTADELGQMPPSAIPAEPTVTVDGSAEITTGSLHTGWATSEEVAAQTRQQLFAAVAAGQLSDEFTYTVEALGSGNALSQGLSVQITVPVDRQELVMVPADNGTDDGRWTELATEAKATVRLIADARNRVRKDVQSHAEVLYTTHVVFVVGPVRA